MSSHRLLLAWGATLSFSDGPPSPRFAEFSRPDRAVLSLKCGGTALRLPPSYVAAELYAFGCVLVHRDTTLAGDIYLLLLLHPLTPRDLLLEMTPLVCSEAGEALDA